MHTADHSYAPYPFFRQFDRKNPLSKSHRDEISSLLIKGRKKADAETLAFVILIKRSSYEGLI